jgi:hypothetical protein
MRKHHDLRLVFINHHPLGRTPKRKRVQQKGEFLWRFSEELKVIREA